MRHAYLRNMALFFIELLPAEVVEGTRPKCGLNVCSQAVLASHYSRSVRQLVSGQA